MACPYLANFGKPNIKREVSQDQCKISATYLDLKTALDHKKTLESDKLFGAIKVEITEADSLERKYNLAMFTRGDCEKHKIHFQNIVQDPLSK